MIDLSLNELKLITKISYSKKKIEEIKKGFNELRYGFSKSKIKEIRKNIYDIKSLKNLSKSKIKQIEQNLIELEENLFKPNNHVDYDDTEYKGIRNVADLFNGIAFKQSTNEDYYQPTNTKSAFNGNYI